MLQDSSSQLKGKCWKINVPLEKWGGISSGVSFDAQYWRHTKILKFTIGFYLEE